MYKLMAWFMIMVFNTTFKNISVISWQSVLMDFDLMEIITETHRGGQFYWTLT